MTQPFIGQLALFPYNFAPKGWAVCDGSLISVKNNSALYSLIGTYYGGDGVTTFALPDLRGRVPNSQGTMPGGSTYAIGERAGVQSVTLSSAQMASHSHNVPAFASAATSTKPNDAPPAQAIQPGRVPVPINLYASPTAGAATTLAPQAISAAGGNAPHNNQQPYLVLEWCIATTGIFPPRP
jgi:microcystin-dependent protein